MTITLFTTTTCRECIPIREYLDKQNLAYEEKLVDRDNNAAKEMVEKTGQASVPVLEIQDSAGETTFVIGSDMVEVNEAVGRTKSADS